MSNGTQDRDELEALAGEYVLGNIAGPDCVAFEARLAQDPALQAAVTAWERRLAPLANAAPRVAPPPELWQRIERSIAPPPVAAVAPRAGWWASLALWRTSALAAAAAAAVLAIALLLQPAPPALPVAVLADAEQRAGFLVAVDAANARLNVTALAARPEAGRAFELWLVPGQGQPRSLGLIPAVGSGQPALAPALARALAPGSTLAVSLEPEGGSPTGQPTGPVVYLGTLTAM